MFLPFTLASKCYLMVNLCCGVRHEHGWSLTGGTRQRRAATQLFTIRVRAATPTHRRVVGMFTHTVSVTQETWDEAERVSHELKHPFQDRHCVWHYKEVAFVEQAIRNYCTMQGLTLRE